MDTIELIEPTTVDEARLQMVAALHRALYGDVWARPEPPGDVWNELLDRVRTLSNDEELLYEAWEVVGRATNLGDRFRARLGGGRPAPAMPSEFDVTIAERVTALERFLALSVIVSRFDHPRW